MKKITVLILGLLVIGVDLSAIQVIYSQNSYRTAEETRILNQREEEMQLLREQVEIQKKMLQEQRIENFRNYRSRGY